MARMRKRAYSEDDSLTPLNGDTVKPNGSQLGLQALLQNKSSGAFMDIFLSLSIAFFSFFSNPLHLLRYSPPILLFTLLFFGRTSSWNGFQTALAIILACSLSTIPYLSVLKLLVPICLFYIIIIALGTIIDRIIFHRFIAWMDANLQDPASQTSKSTRFCLTVRATLSVLFFPLFYPGFYYAADYFPAPLHIGGMSNLAYAASDNAGLLMLAAVGGLPLISFSMVLFASVVSAYMLAFRIQERGMAVWLQNLDAFHDNSVRKLESKICFGFQEGGKESLALRRRSRSEDSETFYKTLASNNIAYSTLPTTYCVMNSGPLVEIDTKVPYRRMATLFRRSLLPVGVLSIFLLLAGPLISVLFDGTFMWTDSTSLASGLSTARMGCLPNCLTEEQVDEAQRAGVKLVITSESCRQSLGEAKSLAKKYNVMIGLGHDIKIPDTETPLARNMFTVVDSRGNTILSHEKFWPVPTLEHLVPVTPRVTTADVPENFFTRSGTVSNMEENKDVISTKDGAENLVVKEKDEAGQKYNIGKERKIKLGAATCFDLYSPNGIAAAGRAGVDLLLVPSKVWTSLHTAHNSVLRMRAVENGFMMFTCTQGGISGVFGPFGETYAQSYKTDKLLIYDVPIHPQRRAFSFFRAYPYISRKFGAGIFISSLICGFFGLVLPA